MKQLILAHNHSIAPLGLPHARALARQLRLQGKQVCLLVADNELTGQLASHDLAQHPVEQDEFSYPSLKTNFLDLEEGNQALLFEVLPRFLSWFNPDNILIVDPALVGWNTIRSVHKALPIVEMKALVTSCHEIDSTLCELEHTQIQHALFESALRVFSGFEVHHTCMNSFKALYGRALACKLDSVEVMS